eukprot:GHRQ01014789.1.p1 GENE.GHRQ01014789.1~~GHRQ01014789.1.p1  ORF type:complete len:353 (+),score=107.44 GHRQ01014789.1:1145-2203(+)
MLYNQQLLQGTSSWQPIMWIMDYIGYAAGARRQVKVTPQHTSATWHAPAGTAGGEAQQADIRQLLKELEMKKAKLNELKGDSRKTDAAIAKMRDDDADAQRLTPDDCLQENAYIQSLRDEMTRVEEDLLEADAKNRLYYLLGERTRREHMAIDQKVCAAVRCRSLFACVQHAPLLRQRHLAACMWLDQPQNSSGRAEEGKLEGAHQQHRNGDSDRCPPCMNVALAVLLQVRDKQDSKRACLEDLANLTEHYNTTRAAKEAAEKELAKTKRQVEEARADWMRKIRERRAEVRLRQPAGQHRRASAARALGHCRYSPFPTCSWAGTGAGGHVPEPPAASSRYLKSNINWFLAGS